MSTDQNGPKKPPGGARPGAMTMAMRAVEVAPQTGPKVLRIGLIQDGRIVEERIIRNRETVSIGTSERNHFIVQADELPARFEVFQLVGNDYILNFTEAMSGRVGLPGGVQALDQLRKSGGARKEGSHWQVKLGDTSRGKVVIGNTTVLFQFVSPPPVQPRPQLPAAARGGFVKGIDWLFAAFVVFSYMVFFGMIVYLESADWPMDQGIAALPDNLPTYIVEEPPPPPEQEEAEESEEESEEEAEPAPSEKQAKGPADDAPSDPGPSQDEVRAEAARIADEAVSQAETMLMGALGEGGALADVLAGGADTTGAAAVLEQASGVGVAKGGAGDLRTRTGGEGSGQGGLGGLKGAGGKDATSAVGTGAVEERVVRGKVNFNSGDEIGGTGVFDQGEVSKVIKGRMSALKRCYETSLKSNPTLAGKVVVEFTIEERGNVSKARAADNSTGDAGFAGCIVDTIKRLRWKKGPDGGSVTFQYPFVFAPQN